MILHARKLNLLRLTVKLLSFQVFSSSAHTDNRLLNSEFQKPSPSKRGHVHILSCENEVCLYEKEKSFAYQRLST